MGASKHLDAWTLCVCVCTHACVGEACGCEHVHLRCLCVCLEITSVLSLCIVCTRICVSLFICIFECDACLCDAGICVNE